MPLLAGGEPGFADGPAAAARFRNPALLALDERGNLFLDDVGNYRVRKLSPDGEVTTVAGCGRMGWRAGPALKAQFTAIGGLEVDPRRPGTLLAVEFLLHCVLAIDLDGDVTVIAGVPGNPGYMDGAVEEARFMNPTAIHAGPSGDLFIADRGNLRIRRIDAERHTVSTLAGGLLGMRDGHGTEAQFKLPTLFAIDMNGTLWVTDTEGHAVRRVDPDGWVTTVAGNGSPGYVDGHGAEARFNRPTSIVVDGKGNLVVADRENHCIRYVTRDGHVSTLLPPFPCSPTILSDSMRCPCRQPVGLVLTKSSELIISDFYRHKLYIVHAGIPPYHRADSDHFPLAKKVSNYADVVIVCGKQRLTADRSVLSPRMPWVAELQRKMVDTTPARWAIPNASLPEVEAFLLYVCTGELHHPEHILGLMDLCQRFKVWDGCEWGLRYCQRHVSPSLAIKWLVEGHLRGLRDLTEWLKLYVTQHWDDIRLVAPQSFNLMQPYPELLEATIPDHRRLQRRLRA